MAFSRFQRASEGTADLNVVPVMNLFMVLIPFLLLGAAFYHIGVIPTSTPQHSPHESDVPKTPTTVSANLAIYKDYMEVTFASTNLAPDELDALSAQWKLKGGEHQGLALQKHLIDIKKMYPESTTITILPHDEIGYQSLVNVLDKLREYQVGVDDKGEPKMAELFPVSVFSRLLIAKPDEGEGGADGASAPVEGAAPEVSEGGSE